MSAVERLRRAQRRGTGIRFDAAGVEALCAWWAQRDVVRRGTVALLVSGGFLLGAVLTVVVREFLAVLP